MGEVRIKRDNPDWDNRPAHQVTNGQWVDIPTHHYTNGRWQGELTSQSPLKFWADGEMLDWRVEGKTSGNLWDGTFINTPGWGVSFSLDNEGYMVASSSSNDTRGWGYTASQIKMTLDAGTYSLVLQGVPPTPSWSGATIYTSTNRALADNRNLVNKPLIIMPFTLEQETSIGIMVKVANGKYRVQLLEGTYTTSTIPEYEPYGGVGDYDETTQRYKILIRIEGENLFDGELEQGGITAGSETVNNARVRTVENTLLKEGTYTINCVGATGGVIAYAYNTDDLSYDQDASYIGWFRTLPFTFVVNDKKLYRFVFKKEDDSAIVPSEVTNVQIYEGTYTASTIPSYEVNLFTDHQLMDGDSIDYTTDQTAIPIATGNNVLTVDTAVQPSKVFVKFEG